MAKAARLRELLKQPGIQVLPGVYDAITGRVAEYCSFPAAYVTGYGTAAAHGFPDYGLLTMTEMVQSLRRISEAVQIPLIADADTGYGNPINVYRTVKEYEKAGVAGIQLEDQTWPKRCGHLEGKTTISTQDMVDKVKAAVDARENPQTVLVIRTDAIAPHGFDDALDRAQQYAEAGADVLFIEAPANQEQIQKIPSLFDKPCLANLAMGNNGVTVPELADMGYKLAIFPVVTMMGAISGALMMCNHLKENGHQKILRDEILDPDKMNYFLGLRKYQELDQKYSSASKKDDKG